MKLFNWYLRWRHSHGFGVHSPFAFDFLCSELRPQGGYAYYGYDMLPRSDKYSPGLLQLIFRVILRLRPHSADTGSSGIDIRRTASLARPHIRFGEQHPELMIIATDTDCDTARCRIGNRHMPHLIILPPYTKAKTAFWQHALTQAVTGMSFGGKHSRALIFVADARLPRQDFDITF